MQAELPDYPECWQTTLGWQPSPHQQQQFQQLYQAILEGNRQFNLTRITAPDEFWEKHLWDSLRGVQAILQRDAHPSTEPQPSPQRGIDIGSGAGFPGLPIAIALPAWHITLLDSTRKKMDFIAQMVATLALPNIGVQVNRAEQLGQHPQHRERYDLATVRAVAGASVCAEYALPLLAMGGYAVLYRGHWNAEETGLLEPAVAELGGVVESVERFATPLTGGDRHCLYLRKVAPTPACYPRAPGLPNQKPLA
jgi:16S rRNA (guanine527-N7)-methyltransferase